MFGMLTGLHRLLESLWKLQKLLEKAFVTPVVFFFFYFIFFPFLFWACHLTDAECFLEEMANNCHLFCKLEIHGLFIYFSHRCHFIPFIISVALFHVFFPVVQVFLRWGDQDCRKYSRSEYTMDFHSSMRLFSVWFSTHFWLSKIYFFDYWQGKNPYL